MGNLFSWYFVKKQVERLNSRERRVDSRKFMKVTVDQKRGSLKSRFSRTGEEYLGPQWSNFDGTLHGGIFSVLTQILKVARPSEVRKHENRGRPPWKKCLKLF